MLLQGGGPQEPGSWAWYVSGGLFLLVILLGGLWLWYQRYALFDEGERRQLRAIRPQLLSAERSRTWLSASDSHAERFEQLETVVDGAPEGTTARSVGSELHSLLGERYPALPAESVRALKEAAAYAIVAGMIVLSIATIEGPAVDATTPLSILAQAGSYISASLFAVIDASIEGLSTIPGGWLVLMLVAFLFIPEVAISVALTTSGILTWLALAAWRTRPDRPEEPLYPRRWRFRGAVLASIGVVWGVGQVSAPLAFLTLLLASGVWAWNVRRRLRARAAEHAGIHYQVFDAARSAVGLETKLDRRGRVQAPSQSVLEDLDQRYQSTYADARRALLYRGALTAAGVVAIPLLLLLVFAALVAGHVQGAIWTLIGLGPIGWVFLAFAGLLSLWVFVVLLPEEYAPVATVIQRAMTSAYIRAELFVYGLPVLAVAIAMLFFSAMFQSLWAGAVIAVIAGVVVKRISRGIVSLRYRFLDFVDVDPSTQEIPVEAQVITDADGRDILVLHIDGHPLAHRDRDELVQTGLQMATHRLGESETEEYTALAEWMGEFTPLYSKDDAPKFPPTLENEFYQLVVDDGIVDFEMAKQAVRGDVKSRIRASVPDRGDEMDREKALRELKYDYPEEEVENALAFLKSRNEIDIRGERVIRRSSG